MLNQILSGQRIVVVLCEEINICQCTLLLVVRASSRRPVEHKGRPRPPVTGHGHCEFGRLASIISKQILCGQKIAVVSYEEINI